MGGGHSDVVGTPRRCPVRSTKGYTLRNDAGVYRRGKTYTRTSVGIWRNRKDQSCARYILAEFRKLPPSSYLRSGVTLEDVLLWLYEVSHIRLSYGLKYNGVDLDKLSPGTKGIVLLILYLGIDVEDTLPLIVDQPDENLDNESSTLCLRHILGLPSDAGR